MHRTNVRVVEDALDANNTIASANRSDFDRDDATVMRVSAKTGEGIEAFRTWLKELPARVAAEAAHDHDHEHGHDHEHHDHADHERATA